MHGVAQGSPEPLWAGMARLDFWESVRPFGFKVSHNLSSEDTFGRTEERF